jgi:proton-dependent oligopeptide transporter, POT family
MDEEKVLEPAVEPPPTKSDRFPPGIPFIVGNEGAERFSFYGMRAILYVYMTSLFVGFVPEAQVAAGALAEAKTHATQVTHLFMAGVYAFPMLGAILADRLLGKYRVILWVSLIYCAGHATLALAGRTEMGMYTGLALIAMGSGGIKPCVSANVGDQFTSANGHLVSKVYQIFYFIINFGSFFSTIITPLLYVNVGADVAFGVPGILMGLATIVFWLGRDRFHRVPAKPGGTLGGLDVGWSSLLFLPFAFLIILRHEMPLGWRLGASALALAGAITLFVVRERRQASGGFFSILLYSLRHQHLRQPGMGFFDVAREKFGEENAEGPKAVLKIMGVFVMVAVFWAIFDQHSSTWIEQAKHMDLTLTVPTWIWSWFVVPGVIAVAAYGGLWLMLWVSNTPIPRAVNRIVLLVIAAWALFAASAHLIDPEWKQLTLQASQIAAMNPLMVMLIIPLLNFGVYRPLERRGIVIKPLLRMSVGMFLAALSFVAVALLQRRIDEAAAVGEKISVVWQFIPYLIVTTSEVLVSVTGLEFAYTQAPRAMKSTVMGFWLLCVTIGNLLVVALAPLQKLSMERFFWTFAGAGVGAAVIFAGLAALYRGKTYLQRDTR